MDRWPARSLVHAASAATVGLLGGALAAVASLGGLLLDWAPERRGHVSLVGLALALVVVLAVLLARPRAGLPPAFAVPPGLLGALLTGTLVFQAFAEDLRRAELLTSIGLAVLGLGLQRALHTFTLARRVRVHVPALPRPPAKLKVHVPDKGASSVPLADVKVGTLFELGRSDRVPFDAVVVEGQGQADERSVTGAPLPEPKGPGDRLFAGSVVELKGALLRVAAMGEATLLGRRRALLRGLDAEARDGLRRGRVALALGAASFVAAIGLSVLAVGPVSWFSALDPALAATLAGAPLLVALALARGRARVGTLMTQGGVHAGHLDDLLALARVRRVVVDPELLAAPGGVEVHPFTGHDGAEVLRVAAALVEGSGSPEARSLERAAAERRLEVPRAAALAHSGAVWRGTVLGTRFLLGVPGAVEAEDGGKLGPEERAALERLRSGGGVVYVLGRPDKGAYGLLAVRFSVRNDIKALARGLEATLAPGGIDAVRHDLAAEAGIAPSGPPLGRRDLTVGLAGTAAPSAGRLLVVEEPGPKALERERLVLLAPAAPGLPATLAAAGRARARAVAVAALVLVLPLALLPALAALELLTVPVGAAVGLALALLVALA